MKMILKLRNIYHWVFKTKHIKALLNAIDQHELDVLEYSKSIFFDKVMFNLKTEVRQYIYQRASIIDKIFNTQSESAYHIAARILIKFCENNVTSGRYNLWGNMLSSEGEAYFFILKKLNSDLVQLGEYSEEEGEEFLTEIRSQIQFLG